MPRTSYIAAPVNPLGQNSGNSLMLPSDHPYTRQRLKESSGNQGHTRTTSSVELSGCGDNGLTQGKRTRSSKNLMSLLDREKTKPRKNCSGEGQKIKKSKSATSLSAIFSRPVSSKGRQDAEAKVQKDKENQTPPETPIWAQFATQGVAEISSTTKVPLNDDRRMQTEIDLYTPQTYTPSKQKNYPANEQPTLSGRPKAKPRPKSECISSNSTQSSISNTISGLRHSRQPQERSKNVEDRSSKPCSDDQKQSRKRSEDHAQPSSDVRGATFSKRGSRVMAAVAVFNGRSKELPQKPALNGAPQPLDPRAIESAFESLLV